MVVPNGTLFGTGVGARIKEELLRDFNLHTIVRLPSGVFAPYTPIPTNLMFFDRSGPTKDIWYYEQPSPEGRRQYSKTQPLQYEELKPCLDWWHKRKQNENAWKVSAEQIASSGYNLDLKNPNRGEDLEHMPPEKLADDILEKERRIVKLLEDIKVALKERVA